MKLLFAGILTLLAASLSAAQGLPSSSLTRHTWELGVLGGGGEGLGKSDNTQFLLAGGRGGWVLTGEHLPGILRGNFEWAVDVLPAYVVFTPQRAVYGASIKPFIWEWNFTHWQRVAPFFGVAGGALFTVHNVPPGDTSTINFSPQIDLGVHIFTRRSRAATLEMDIVHHSNASIGNQNPGYNVSALFTVGYVWYRTHK